MNRAAYILPVIILVIAGLLASIFIVDEREKVLVLRFGQIKQERVDPGWYFKVPFLDEVVRYEDRILSLETPLIEVTPADDRRLQVDAFVLWRISNMVQFRQALGVGGQREAEAQLLAILDGQIRAVLGSDGVMSNTIISPERTALMDQIEERVNTRAKALGIDVVDVRLRQTNLPPENFDATLRRMVAEREREAIDERARGKEAAQRVSAAADRTYEELISEANRDARIIEGEADAERNRIFAKAYGQDQEFFEFYRSLSAYEAAMKGSNSTMVISPDSEFFRYLGSDGSEVARPVPLDPEAAAALKEENAAAVRAARAAVREAAEAAEAVTESGAVSSPAAHSEDQAPAADAEPAPAEEAPAQTAPADEAESTETPAETSGN